ncbi:MAG: YcgN family cysteine cluster protein [Alphaproteobacteria bacterium]|nr:YcgN family cysteine cluster protein [Alphaproteobacteria bacterium]
MTGRTKVAPFWKTKALNEMTEAEWESLCDGCGRCCVIGLEDEDTGAQYMTDLSCALFDSGACGCGDYANRFQKVDDCTKLTPENVPDLYWLPPTCAYRLVAQGRDLYWWHPLKSGDPETVHASGASVRGKVKPERGQKVRSLMRHIVDYPEPAKRAPRKAR